VSKQRFGFQTTRWRGMAKSRCKVNVITALTNLFPARRLLLAAIPTGKTVWPEVLIGPAKERTSRGNEQQKSTDGSLVPSTRRPAQQV